MQGHLQVRDGSFLLRDFLLVDSLQLLIRHSFQERRAANLAGVHGDDEQEEASEQDNHHQGSL